jgi:xanthine/uracil permease
VSSIVAGVIMLSTRMWVGVSHIYNGDNWVDVLQTPLNVVGTILTVAGFGMVFWAIWNVMRQEIEETAPKTGIQSVSS